MDALSAAELNSAVGQPAHPGTGAQQASYSWLWMVLAAEVLIVDLYQLPTHLKFDMVAFGDHGLNLTAEYLIRSGYRPALDFSYPYGALSLLFGNAWFKFFGMTPAAWDGGILACDVVFAVGLARFANRLRLGLAGLALIFVAVPFSVVVTISFAHALERVFLCWGLAEQAGGRRANAVALATAAVFAKPSMGYVYGLLLILVTIWRRHESRLGLRALAIAMVPAGVAGLTLFAVVTGLYGMPVAFDLLVPSSKMYRINHFGFLGSGGRTFWYFPGVHIGYYFGTVCAFWFAATLCLVIGAGYAAGVLVRSPIDGRGFETNYELVLSCALMHLAFVTLFFGSNASWTSYVYVLVMGVAAMSVWSRNAARIAGALVVLGVVGQKSFVADNYRGWLYTAPEPVTAGLWAPADERREWRKVLDLVRGHRAVVLSGDGAAPLLFQELEKPVALTLIGGQTSSGEIARQLERLAQAQIAVVPEVPENLKFLDRSPQFKKELEGWKDISRGKFFSVYRST